MTTRSRIWIGIGIAVALVALISSGIVYAQGGRQGLRPFAGPLMQGRGAGMGPMGPLGPRGMGPMQGPRGLGLPLAQLGVTAEQRAQIAKILENHRADHQALADRLQPAHKALRDATEAGPENAAAIKAAAAALGEVLGDQAVLQAQIHAEILAVLTPEQREKAKQIRLDLEQRRQQQAERWRAMRKHGPVI